MRPAERVTTVPGTVNTFPVSDTAWSGGRSFGEAERTHEGLVESGEVISDHPERRRNDEKRSSNHARTA
jgi:hypothetical protein